MNGITFTNDTGRKLTLIIEPIAEEYALNPGEKIELRPPLFLDHREIVEVQLTSDCVIVYAPEEVSITKDGKRVPWENR